MHQWAFKGSAKASTILCVGHRLGSMAFEAAVIYHQPSFALDPNGGSAGRCLTKESALDVAWAVRSAMYLLPVS
jgi:hypothetical protein